MLPHAALFVNNSVSIATAARVESTMSPEALAQVKRAQSMSWNSMPPPGCNRIRKPPIRDCYESQLDSHSWLSFAVARHAILFYGRMFIHMRTPRPSCHATIAGLFKVLIERISNKSINIHQTNQ
ncbi:hypothetical protein FRB94_003592 [Tulasnella sp. JGI-2019a]|nr:hypothetical protein FRB93_002577 [Tulasnella sp. JGI-2019a]KAG9013152.1 hypothetical protein FRB94_003592 [Tulasnella sp. JGI-2019a]KAG9032188.1 hypothetical protein FRB95_001815 [Tulasnella sp. JGI-2019a]